MVIEFYSALTDKTAYIIQIEYPLFGVVDGVKQKYPVDKISDILCHRMQGEG